MGWAGLDRRLNSPTGFRALIWIFIITAIVLSAIPLLHYFRGGSIKDYKLWYDTGTHVLAGHEIFFFRSGKYDFMYPPPCALFLAGASLLGQAGLILLLVAINSVAWFYSARLAAILAVGQRHVTNAWLYLIPSLLVIVYIWSSYHLGQANLVLLALMLGAFLVLRGKREIFAGALVAFAAAIKAFPIIAIVYLIYRRHWSADAASAPHTPVYANFADFKFATVNVIIMSIAVALGVLFIVVIPERAMRTAESDAIEFALLILMMLTPLSFGYFFSWLILPFAVVTQRVLAHRTSSLLWWSVAALAILALALLFPRVAQTYGNVCFATLLLFIGLSIELLRWKRESRHISAAPVIPIPQVGRFP